MPRRVCPMRREVGDMKCKIAVRLLFLSAHARREDGLFGSRRTVSGPRLVLLVGSDSSVAKSGEILCNGVREWCWRCRDWS